MAVDPVNVPRTAVPNGIVDPVASARAELKAALLAIEEKGNVPRRLEKATVEGKVKLRAFARHNPVGAVAAAVGVAAVVGGIVWAVARSIAR